MDPVSVFQQNLGKVHCRGPVQVGSRTARAVGTFLQPQSANGNTGSRIAGSNQVREAEPVLNCSSVASSIVPSRKSWLSFQGRQAACRHGPVARRRSQHSSAAPPQKVIRKENSFPQCGGNTGIMPSSFPHAGDTGAPGPLAFMHLTDDPGGHDLVRHLSNTRRVNLMSGRHEVAQGCHGYWVDQSEALVSWTEAQAIQGNIHQVTATFTGNTSGKCRKVVPSIWPQTLKRSDGARGR